MQKQAGNFVEKASLSPCRTHDAGVYHRMKKEPRYLDTARRRINPAFDHADRYHTLARRKH